MRFLCANRYPARPKTLGQAACPNSYIENLESRHLRVSLSHWVFKENRLALSPPTGASGLDRGLVPRWSPFRGRPFFQGNRLDFIGKWPAALRFFIWTCFWSAEIAARIVGVAVAPLLYQCFKLGIVPVGQNNPGRHEQVAGSARLRQPLALEAEGAAA